MLKAIFILIFILFTAISSSFAQAPSSADKMIMKIDSISRATHISTGVVKSYQVGAIGDKTATDDTMLSKREKFVFDGPFLVIGEKYFNMDKLLFFAIRNDYFEFYLQSY
jgi:hypothetical protein